MIPIKKHKILLSLASFIIIGCASSKKEINENLIFANDELGTKSDSTMKKGPKYASIERVVKSDTLYIISALFSDTLKRVASGKIIKIYDEDPFDEKLRVIENDSIIGYVTKIGALGVASGPMMVIKTVNIRSGRSVNSKIIGQLKAGIQIDVDSLLSGWYRVPNYLSTTGYVYSKLLQTVEDYQYNCKSPQEIKWGKNRSKFVETGRRIIRAMRGYHEEEFFEALRDMVALGPLAEEIIKPLKGDPNSQFCWTLLGLVEGSKTILDHYHEIPFLNPLALMGGNQEYFWAHYRMYLNQYVNWTNIIDTDWPLKKK